MQSADLRMHNLSRVLRTIANTASNPSRADVSRSTHLTKPTVSSLVEELVAAGMVVEGSPTAGRQGRPQVPLRIASRSILAIGLEVTADGVHGLGTDLSGTEIWRDSISFSVVDDDVRGVVAACGRLKEAAVGATRSESGRPLPVAGVCIAIPGRVSMDGDSILSAPILQWAKVPFGEEVRNHPAFRATNVMIRNDNQLAVRQEILGRPRESFLYIRGSTGVGGAVVLNGAPLSGQHGWAGEVGHVVVEPGGRRCRCGRQGCLEAYTSRSALHEYCGCPDDRPMTDVLSVLLSGHATDALQIIGRALGAAISGTLNVLDLTEVVLAGYFADLRDSVEPWVRSVLAERALGVEGGEILLRRGIDGGQPALVGAASAVLEPVFERPADWLGRLQGPAALR